MFNNFRLIYSLVILYLAPCRSLHLRGTWHTGDEFFRFLAKFGFQQTDMNDKANTQGYIYGNVSAASGENITTSVTFLVVDSQYFLEYYGNRSVQPRTKACPAMFQKIEGIAWDRVCNAHAQEDFIRQIPCEDGQLCEDEDQEWVIPGYQFTYKVQDVSQPRFWYISMVSCYHDTSNASDCIWSHNDGQDIALEYDVWLVNGHPFMKHINPFEHQFSFDRHDIFEVYLAFFILYMFLMPIQLYALSRQKHMLPLLLTTCMTMEFVGIIFNLIHVLKFAFDGYGVELLKVTGNFIDNVAQCLFMLLLVVVVKGWTITRMDLSGRSKVVMFTVWGTYTVANMALFIWNLTEIDIISDLDEWQTWPGWLILMFRIAIMIWFILELRETFLLERSHEKMRFYLHFGAGFLVWFVYLPIVAVICTQVSALWRYKTLLSVTYSADFVSFCVLVHLLWPARSYIYFNLKVDSTIPLDELEFAGSLSDNLYTSDDDDDEDEILETAKLLKMCRGKRPENETPPMHEMDFSPVVSPIPFNETPDHHRRSVLSNVTNAEVSVESATSRPATGVCAHGQDQHMCAARGCGHGHGLQQCNPAQLDQDRHTADGEMERTANFFSEISLNDASSNYGADGQGYHQGAGSSAAEALLHPSGDEENSPVPGSTNTDGGYIERDSRAEDKIPLTTADK